MAQLFRSGANTAVKVSLIVFAATPLLAIYGGSALSNSSYNTKVNVPLDQPVPFSHRHHAWELGIDCRYCHVSVEKSSNAGIPPTETCMSCHSQIWTNSPLLETVRKSYETGEPIKFADGSPGWNLVNKVPEFVYFNHAIHVNRGISCNTCHGAVQKMHLTWKGNSFSMKWCLSCHREPEKYLYKDAKNPNLSPREQVFNLYLKQQTGEELSPRERRILNGQEQVSTTAVDVKEGHELVKELGVTTQQLADCSVCHH
jgi:hypothetical protein